MTLTSLTVPLIDPHITHSVGTHLIGTVHWFLDNQICGVPLVGGLQHHALWHFWTAVSCWSSIQLGAYAHARRHVCITLFPLLRSGRQARISCRPKSLFVCLLNPIVLCQALPVTVVERGRTGAVEKAPVSPAVITTLLFSYIYVSRRPRSGKHK